MKIKSARQIEKLRDVLKDPKSSGPETAYWVFNEISSDKNPKWYNMTITTPGDYNGEFPKTYGHYHSVEVDETYKLISGKGLFLLQKRKFIDDDWANDQIDTLLLVVMNVGEEIIITPEWGHSWSNIGNEPLVTFDNWNSGHTDSDYEPIQNMRGMAYYLVKDKDTAKFVKNENYKEVPTPQLITTDEYMQTYYQG